MHLHKTLSLPGLCKTAVEVAIWENYLLRNKTNISTSLSAYSLDNGPWHHEFDGRLTFRFTAFDWSNSIEEALHREHIYCEVLCYFRFLRG